jgi:CMP-N-acetylneuraminic acid synthetase
MESGFMTKADILISKGKIMEVLAVIPARSGSKSVKDKNIRLINGVPMLAYSVKHALEAETVTRTIISTDSEKYADIAKKYGCEVPFIRPAEYSTDTALDFDVFYHALTYMKEKENYVPDIVVQLRPTYPIRNVHDIDAMVQMLVDDEEADSVRCIAPAKEVAYKMWREQDGVLTPLLDDIPEAYNMPRQQLPKIYYQNACIDVFRASTILEKKSMSGEKILGYKMTHNFDIDTEEDFLKAEQIMLLLDWFVHGQG